MTSTLRAPDIAEIIKDHVRKWSKPGAEITVLFDRDDVGVYARVTVEGEEV